jgi:hypothetical protein
VTSNIVLVLKDSDEITTDKGLLFKNCIQYTINKFKVVENIKHHVYLKIFVTCSNFE